MVTQLAPLQNPVLDPRNDQELLRRAIQTVFVASRGDLNSFSDGDPVRVLLEGQVFATSELLYYLNQLPEAFTIQFLQVMGIQRKLGTFSQVTLTFTLERVTNNPFTIPNQFRCQTAGRIEFRTDQQLIIPAGAVSGNVSATCTTLGSSGNVGAYSIRSIQTPLTFLKAVTNIAPATGGVDGETLDQVKTRAFATIRRRGLVTRDDYEQAAITLLGVGSVAHAVGNLGADRISVVKGSVHLFVLNKDGTLLSDAQLTSLQSSLSAQAHLGTDTYVSNIAITPIDVRVTAKLVSGTNPATVANTIFQRLDNYLKPGRLPLGETILIKELEFQARLAGVESIQSVLQGDHLSVLTSTNHPLPFQYSAAQLEGLTVELVLEDATFSYSFGEGDLD